MSLKAYEQAKSIIAELSAQRLKGLFILGGKSDYEINTAERLLGLQFPLVYKMFLRDYGLLGIPPDFFQGFRSLDNADKSEASGMVWHTLKERKHGLDSSLVCFSYSGDGWIYALDCANLDAEGDAPVLAYEGWDTPKSKMPVVAKGFGEFLLERAQWALDRLKKKESKP